VAWSLNTLEVPPQRVVDAGQKTPTPMSVFNDRECRLSVIAHNSTEWLTQRHGHLTPQEAYTAAATKVAA